MDSVETADIPSREMMCVSIKHRVMSPEPKGILKQHLYYIPNKYALKLFLFEVSLCCNDLIKASLQ